MAKALRRGIAHYQEGVSEVPQPNRAFLADRAADPNAGRGVLPVAPPGATVASAPIPAPGMEPHVRSGATQLLSTIPFTGERDRFAAAERNPESSPFTAYLARINREADAAGRARDAAMGPGLLEQGLNFFFGNKAERQVLDEQNAVSRVLQHPTVQQHMRNDPNALAAAEKDPAGFSQVVQLPEYIKHMEATQKLYADAQNHPRIHPSDVSTTAGKARAAGTTVGEAHTSVAPQNYSRDEFINIVGNMPTRTVLALFGPSIAHNADPRTIATKKYLGGLQDEFDRADVVYRAMLDDPTSGTTGLFGGESRLSKAKAERDKRWDQLLKGQARIAGAASKSFPTGDD